MAILGSWTQGSGGELPGKKKEGTAGGISGGGSFLWMKMLGLW